MKINKRCPFSGAINSMNIDVTQAQIDKWQGGTLVQVAFPNISAAEREFIMTGITPAQWAKTFPEE